ncbi:MAG: DUF748 domain-containing protein, partial [Bacteroidetes bacterium]|nr:DUF748 domain-containing protein [Bacteroidota bacterium]
MYKIFLWVFGIFLGLVLLILLLVSPVICYIVEKNSENWIGRTVEIEKLGINLLNGKINIRGLSLYEAVSDTVFFHANQILVDINLWKLWNGIYHIEKFNLVDPSVRIIQKGDAFNFSDLILRFPADTTGHKKDTSSGKPIKYKLENLSISGGNIHYISRDFYSDINVKEIALKIPLIGWNDSIMDLNYSLTLASGGEIAGSFHVNQQTLGYTTQVKVDTLHTSIILPYLQPYLMIKKLEGTCSLTMTIDGNMNDPYRSVMQGKVDLRNLDIMGSKGQKELAFNHFSIAFDSMNTIQGFANIGNVLLDGLFIREDRYINSTSFSQLIIRNFDGYTPAGIAPDSAFIISSKSNPVILLIDFIKKMQEVVVIDSFSVEEVSVKNGVFQFADYTLLKPEHLTVEDITLTIDGINSLNCKAKGTFHTKVNST